MRAAVYYGTRDIRVEEWPDPPIRPGELVLEVHAAGICGTDATEFDRGPLQYPTRSRDPRTGHLGPLIPGHEVTGRVTAVGPGVQGFEIGEVVVSGGGISCGKCQQCRSGRSNLCRDYATVGLQRHGALAQYCAVPASTCLPVAPYELTEDTAALAQPMAIAHHAMRQGQPRQGQTATVLGAGGIGAFLTYALADLGVEVVVADVQEERLATAKALGASLTVCPTEPDRLSESLRNVAPHPALVYEVTGSATALQVALELVEPGGRVVVVALHDDPRPMNVRRLTLAEITLVGTMAHVCATDLPYALDLLRRRPTSWTDVAPIALGLDQLVEDGILPLVQTRGERAKTIVDPWAERPRPTTHTRGTTSVSE